MVHRSAWEHGQVVHVETDDTQDAIGFGQTPFEYTFKLTPCGRTFLVHYVPDAPPMRTGHDGQRIHDERLGLTSAVLPA